MTVGSAAVEEVLLALKLAFLVLLYLFIWQIVRTASRDIRTPQDTVVVAPQTQATRQQATPAPPQGRHHLLEGKDHVHVAGLAAQAGIEPRQGARPARAGEVELGVRVGEAGVLRHPHK